MNEKLVNTVIRPRSKTIEEIKKEINSPSPEIIEELRLYSRNLNTQLDTILKQIELEEKNPTETFCIDKEGNKIPNPIEYRLNGLLAEYDALINEQIYGMSNKKDALKYLRHLINTDPINPGSIEHVKEIAISSDDQYDVYILDQIEGQSLADMNRNPDKSKFLNIQFEDTIKQAVIENKNISWIDEDTKIFRENLYKRLLSILNGLDKNSDYLKNVFNIKLKIDALYSSDEIGFIIGDLKNLHSIIQSDQDIENTRIESIEQERLYWIKERKSIEIEQNAKNIKTKANCSIEAYSNLLIGKKVPQPMKNWLASFEKSLFNSKHQDEFSENQNKLDSFVESLLTYDNLCNIFSKLRYSDKISGIVGSFDKRLIKEIELAQNPKQFANYVLILSNLYQSIKEENLSQIYDLINNKQLKTILPKEFFIRTNKEPTKKPDIFTKFRNFFTQATKEEFQSALIPLKKHNILGSQSPEAKLWMTKNREMFVKRDALLLLVNKSIGFEKNPSNLTGLNEIKRSLESLSYSDEATLIHNKNRFNKYLGYKKQEAEELEIEIQKSRVESKRKVQSLRDELFKNSYLLKEFEDKLGELESKISLVITRVDASNLQIKILELNLEIQSFNVKLIEAK